MPCRYSAAEKLDLLGSLHLPILLFRTQWQLLSILSPRALGSSENSFALKLVSSCVGPKGLEFARQDIRSMLRISTSKLRKLKAPEMNTYKKLGGWGTGANVLVKHPISRL